MCIPFTKTWSEELVAEWLELQGYFVEVSTPIRTTSHGGRREADVIGIRIKNGVLQIMHLEVGGLTGGAEENIRRIRDKFSEENQKAIINICRNKLGFTGEVHYEYLFIATFASKKTIQLAKKEGIKLKTLSDFILEEVIPTIDEWRKNPLHKPKTRGSIVLPDGLWLLNLIELMRKLKCEEGF